MEREIQSYIPKSIITNNNNNTNNTNTITNTNNNNKFSSSRTDNRSYNTLRSMFIKTKIVNNASGSAYVEIGNTKVICSLHGPKISKKKYNTYSDEGRIYCDFKYAPFAQKQRRRRGQDPDEREYSTIIADTLTTSILIDKFPKNTLELYIIVLEDDGSVLSTAINAASLACADAGIEMYDLVASCTVSYSPSWLLDPVLSEESRLFVSEYSNSRYENIDDIEGQVDLEDIEDDKPNLEQIDDDIKKGNSNVIGGLMLAYMPSLGQITYMSQIGAIPQTVLSEVFR